MSSPAPSGPAHEATPRPKAPPAASASSDSVTTSAGSRPSHTRGPSQGANTPQPPVGGTAGGRRGARATTADPLSDRATTILIRRILCPQISDKGKASPPLIEDLLPPLTSRNDVDLQLYALIAIILREFVQNWYNKITPDETFVAEIVHIIAHITRALEQRLRKTDLESLLLDEIPSLLDKHITVYRTAHDPVVQHPLQANPEEVYHSLCPLPALSPVPNPDDLTSIAEQAKNEAAYRQLLVHAVLVTLLPTEDLQNGCLAALVGQIFSELIIANAVANKLSEPWMIYEMLIIASRTILQKRTAGNEGIPGKLDTQGSSGKGRWSIYALFWTVLQWSFFATSFVRGLFTVILASRSVPFRALRSKTDDKNVTDHNARLETTQPASLSETRPEPVKVPVLAFRCWAAISNLIEMDARMPWLHGTLSLMQWIAMTGPGRIAGLDGRLDRLLSYGIHRYLLDPMSLPPLLRNVRGALFPNNAPGTSTLVAPSSEAEFLRLRRRCARALLALVPLRGGVGGALAWLYFNGHLSTSSSGSTGLSRAERGQAGVGGQARRGAQRAKPSAPASASTVSRASAETPQCQGQGQGQGQGHGSLAPKIPEPDVLTRRSGSPHRDRGPRSAPNSGAGGGGQAASKSAALARGLAGDASNKSKSVGSRADEDADVDDCDDDAMLLDEIETGILNVFGDAYCNKHLVYSIVELILVRLLPELAERGPSELLVERIPSP